MTAKRPRDVNELARRLVDEATGNVSASDDKNPAYVESGRKGGLKGGRARADKLTPAERSAAARRAAKARWQKP